MENSKCCELPVDHSQLKTDPLGEILSAVSYPLGSFPIGKLTHWKILSAVNYQWAYSSIEN